ncbi:MAG: hypothetical protein FJX65_16230 [Alphaproteobacteria bacterium]|nr:hypothetical protein [Alphaproteobacteria bacterium]
MVRPVHALVRSLVVGSLTAAFALPVAAPSFAQDTQQLRVGAAALPPGRGNPYKGVGAPHIYTWAAMFDSLVNVDLKGAAVPGLALRWTNVDRQTWRLTLRPNVRYTNGEPFNAKAVVSTFEYVTSEKGLATLAGRNFRGYAAREIDDLTVEIRTEAPNPIVPNVLASLVPLAPKAWADGGDDGYSAQPASTGPYRLESWAGETANLAAFGGSWRAPKVARLTIIALPERAARLQAFVSGQVEIMVQPSTDDVPAIRSAGHAVDVAPGPLTTAVGLVQEGPKALAPFKDKRVRQALNYAVDKEALNRDLLAGLYHPASQPSNPSGFGYNESLKPYPYDPDRAKRLLSEAGYASGFEFVIEFFGDEGDIYQRVASDLGKIGVRARINSIAVADWLKKFNANSWEGNAFNHTFGIAPEIDAGKIFGFNSCMKENPWYCDRSFMPNIERINSEFDPARRRAMLNEAMAWYREEAVGLYLFERPELTAVSKRVRGFESINRAFQYDKMTLVP